MSGVDPPPFHSHQSVITDPVFYLLAIPAVTLLGLSKGGFAGLGMVTTPMLALIMPPLQAAAILLPLLIIQDAISVWTYRHAWSAWNLKVLIPGAAVGMTVGALFAGHVSNAAIELTVGAIGLFFVLYTWSIRWFRPNLAHAARRRADHTPHSASSTARCRVSCRF